MTLFKGGPRTAKRIFEASLSSSKSILSKEGAGSFLLYVHNCCILQYKIIIK
jgi:hypothetical protein